MARTAAAILVVVLLAGACSAELTTVGDDTELADATGAGGTAADVAEAGAVHDVEQVAPDLVYLGDLAPVTSTRRELFDEAGGALQLSSDSLVEVPAGAFAAPTELRATEIELVFDRYATGAPRARIYRLSTPDEIELGAPVVLDVGTAPATVAVMRLVDGTWQPVEIEAGDTTRVSIDHFSDITIAVGERIEDTPILNTEVDPRARVAAEFLGSCLAMLGAMAIERKSPFYGSTIAADVAISRGPTSTSRG